MEVKPDDLRFKIEIQSADGQLVPVQLTKDGLRSLLVRILSMVATVPVPPDLDRQLTLDENPVPSNGFMVTPLEGDPTGGHVSIGIGPLDLQFAVSLGVLIQALDHLKGQTELDPTSLRRPN